MSDSKPLFTIEEANLRLPLVRSIVTDIVDLYDTVTERRARLTEIKNIRGEQASSVNDVYSEEVQQDERDLEQDAIRLRGFVSELHELGVELKDATIGLVDFRATLEEREVCLCWQPGETEISFWHEIAAGVAGRQPLIQEVVTEDVHRDSMS